jgi:L-ascorbate metabolism protein UlaG (beta-lactamase superfamily)
MIIHRLPWAGIMVEADGHKLLIDPLYYYNEAFFGKAHEPFVPLGSLGTVDAVLVTHAHSDHFDHRAIATFWGKDVPVYVPLEALHTAKEQSQLPRLIGAALHQTFTVGPFAITATHSVDGLGDPQVAWVVQGNGKTMIHCGDTLWHGYWWQIAKAFGPFDAACLPINGAVIADPDLTPSDQPICLTPEQAVSAAGVLGAKRLIPIHFGVFHAPPQYMETPDALGRLEARARLRNITPVVLKPFESLTL